VSQTACQCGSAGKVPSSGVETGTRPRKNNVEKKEGQKREINIREHFSLNKEENLMLFLLLGGSARKTRRRDRDETNVAGEKRTRRRRR